MNLKDTGQYIEANGLKIHYYDHGTGPPLILLHGGTGTALQTWEPCIPAFAQHYRVIAPDCRGQGQTTNPTGEFTYQLMADDTVAFIKALGVTHPFICGWSDGGQIVLELGIQHPGLAQGLIAGGISSHLTFTATLNAGGILAPGKVDFDTIQTQIPEMVTLLQTLHSAIYGPDYWKTLLTNMSKMWLNPKEYPGNRLQAITDPTLIVHGDRDAFIPLDNAITAHQLIPNAELAIIPNGDHMTLTTTSTLYRHTILDFLTRHTPK
ncbi:MAG: alpha/beta fold hydrolase [Candidatus Thorarchaeota archaeon]